MCAVKDEKRNEKLMDESGIDRSFSPAENH